VVVKANVNVKEKAPVSWPGLTAVGERRELKDEGVVRNVLGGELLTARHYAVRGAEFLSEYLLIKALALVRARSLFVDLIDGLTPSASV